MAIIVSIDINHKNIHKTYAVNISDSIGIDYGKGEQLYEQIVVGDEKPIQVRHNFEDGAIELAIKMLENMKDKK